MIRRGLFPALLLCLMLSVIPAGALVPLVASENTNVSTAFSINDPVEACAVYGTLDYAGSAAYFRFSLKEGDRLSLVLMNAGPQSPVPDMVILSPGTTGAHTTVSGGIEIPAGYTALTIPGHTPSTVQYEPFTPAATYEVASCSTEVLTPGIYYLAIVSRKNQTDYSFASGYNEEFSPSEWLLFPFSAISTHLREGQPLLSILAPFLSVLVLGIIVIGRREQRNGSRAGPVFWFATVAGLMYLGGSALTLVQMLRVLEITGVRQEAAITIIFAAIPAVMGICTLRLARRPVPRSRLDRISLLLIGGLGLVFWAGLIIGPVSAVISALVPEKKQGTS
jgi:hypothetical protein